MSGRRKAFHVGVGKGPKQNRFRTSGGRALQVQHIERRDEQLLKTFDLIQCWFTHLHRLRRRQATLAETLASHHSCAAALIDLFEFFKFCQHRRPRMHDEFWKHVWQADGEGWQRRTKRVQRDSRRSWQHGGGSTAYPWLHRPSTVRSIFQHVPHNSPNNLFSPVYNQAFAR